MSADSQGSQPTAAAASRRLVILAGLGVGVVILTAGFAMACTVYQGVLTVEGAGGSSYSLVGHTGDSSQSDFMNRCEAESDYAAGSTPEAENGKESGSSTAESIIVEVAPYDSDVDGDGSMSDCGNGGSGHQLPDDSTYYINTWDNNQDSDDDAYDDDDDNDVYEDHECGLLSCWGDESTERQTDCMGDGNNDTIHNKAQESVTNGTFDSGNDANGNGVDDVTITIDEASDSNTDTSPSHASAVCVSDSNEADGWMAPLIIK